MKLSKEETYLVFYISLCSGLGLLRQYGLRVVYNGEDFSRARKKLYMPCYEDILLQVIRDGGSIGLEDRANNGTPDAIITQAMVFDAISRLPPNQSRRVLDDEAPPDLTAGILQLIAYGKLIFQ